MQSRKWPAAPFPLISIKLFTIEQEVTCARGLAASRGPIRPPAEPSDADTDRGTAPNELARFMLAPAPAPAPVAAPAPVPDVLRTTPFPLVPELVRCRGGCCQEAERSCPEGVRDTPLRSETTLPGPPPPPPATGLAKLPELVRSSWPADGGREATPVCNLDCSEGWPCSQGQEAGSLVVYVG